MSKKMSMAKAVIWNLTQITKWHHLAGVLALRSKKPHHRHQRHQMPSQSHLGNQRSQGMSEYAPTEPGDDHPAGDAPGPPAPADIPVGSDAASDEPSEEPPTRSGVPTPKASTRPALDPATAALYEPAGPETFQQQRLRLIGRRLSALHPGGTDEARQWNPIHHKQNTA